MARTPSRTVATVLKHAKADGRSLRQIAADTGIPSNTIVRWARGEEPAAFADLERMAKALGLRIVVKGASESH